MDTISVNTFRDNLKSELGYVRKGQTITQGVVQIAQRNAAIKQAFFRSGKACTTKA
jgi:hypothetical protein